MKKGVWIIISFALIALLGFFALNLLLPQNVLGQYKTMDLARAATENIYKDATLLHSEPYKSRYYDFVIKEGWLYILPVREHTSVLGSRYSITTSLGIEMDTKLKNMAAHYEQQGRLDWKAADATAIFSAKEALQWCILPATYIVDLEAENLSSVAFSYDGQSYILYLKK